MCCFQSCFPQKFILLKLNSFLSCVPRTECNFREFLWYTHFSFSSAFPLPRKSIWHLVVFKDEKCKRGSSLTLKVRQKPVRKEPNFMWRTSEQSCGDRRSVKSDFMNITYEFRLSNYTRWLQMFQGSSYSTYNWFQNLYEYQLKN